MQALGVGRWACWRWALGVLALGAQVGRAGHAEQAAGGAGRALGAAGHGRASGRRRCRQLSAWAGGVAGARACGAGGGRRAGRATGEVQALGARQAGAGHEGRARPGRWARGLGARAGYELCTRCTRPVFDPV